MIPVTNIAMTALQIRTIQLRSRELRDVLVGAPYTSVGCYPMFAVANDGAALCHHCCTSERRQIGTTTGNDGWAIVDLAINWEDDNLYCSHCGERIESAYGE